MNTFYVTLLSSFWGALLELVSSAAVRSTRHEDVLGWFEAHPVIVVIIVVLVVLWIISNIVSFFRKKDD